MTTFPTARDLTPEEREDLDETRRLIYSVVFRPTSTKPSGEMLGTIVNALAHHSGLMTQDELAKWMEVGYHSATPLIPYIAMITDRLDANRWPTKVYW